MSKSIVLAILHSEKNFSFYTSENQDVLKAKKEVEFIEFHEKVKSALDSRGIKYILELKENWRDENYNFTFKPLEILIEQHHFFELIEEGFKLELKTRHEILMEKENFNDVVHRAEKIIEKMEGVISVLPELSFNQKCEVHVPGLGLLSINRTMLLEDSCTDALAEAMSNGWRIIAACPQPDQRRPDYILGKYDPDYNPATDSAVRHSNSR